MVMVMLKVRFRVRIGLLFIYAWPTPRSSRSTWEMHAVTERDLDSGDSNEPFPALNITLPGSRCAAQDPISMFFPEPPEPEWWSFQGFRWVTRFCGCCFCLLLFQRECPTYDNAAHRGYSYVYILCIPPKQTSGEVATASAVAGFQWPKWLQQQQG